MISLGLVSCPCKLAWPKNLEPRVAVSHEVDSPGEAGPLTVFGGFLLEEPYAYKGTWWMDLLREWFPKVGDTGERTLVTSSLASG